MNPIPFENPQQTHMRWLYWCFACVIVFSCALSSLMPFGDSNIRISVFDPLFVLMCTAAAYYRVLNWHPYYWMLIGLGGLTLTHAGALCLLSGDLQLAAMVKNTAKLVYAFAAIGVLSGFFLKHINKIRMTPAQLIITCVLYVILLIFLEMNRPHIQEWQMRFRLLMPSTPVAIFMVTFFLHFWINRYYYKTHDLKTFLIVQPLCSLAFLYFLRVNALKGFFIPFYICVLLPYLYMLFQHWKASSNRAHRLRLCALFLLFWLAFTEFFIGFCRYDYFTYQKWFFLPEKTKTVANAAPPEVLAGGSQIHLADNLLNFTDSMDDILNGNDSGLQSRVAMWQVSLESIAQNPILGIGAGQVPSRYFEVMKENNWRNTSSIHNTLLSLLMWFGIFSLPFFAFMFFLIFKSYSSLGVWEFVNIHCILGASVLLHDMYGMQGFWLYLAYILATVIERDNQRKRETCAASPA